MLKYLIISLTLISCGVRQVSPAKTTEPGNTIITGKNIAETNGRRMQPTIHQFKVKSLDGGEINFADFKGKKILIVNTASKCGYTPQYSELQKLYQGYGDRLVIVGFPSNDFGKQEPGSAAEIIEFCQKNYGVSFPMAEKVTVRGESAHPIYQWLTQKSLNGVLDAEIKWNFGKFLIDEQGKVMAYYPSKVSPVSEEILKNL